MAEDGGEIVVVEGEEQEGEVSGARVLYISRDNSALLQDWALHSPMHLAAYNGELALLQEMLKDSK